MSLTPQPFRATGRCGFGGRPLRSATLAAPRHPGGLEVAVPAALATLLLLVALVVAPERPQVQEAICQRHNGVEACRVW